MVSLRLIFHAALLEIIAELYGLPAFCTARSARGILCQQGDFMLIRIYVWAVKHVNCTAP
jgi:hypothetical protein